MANVAIIGKKGSRAKKDILTNTDVRLYKGQKTDVIVNYGLAGQKLRALFRRYPKANRTSIINKHIGLSKYQAVIEAEQIGVRVPDSKLSLPPGTRLSNWIEKKFHSSQGKGIIQARSRKRLASKYYQKRVRNRKFELRVHAFLWVPTDEWALYKRHGPADQIAWNFHQGGHFQTVHYPNKYKIFLEAKEASVKVLKQRNMAFGAVDFIVDEDDRVFFIEINSSPGFTPLSEHVYFDAMDRLIAMSAVKARKYGR
jgi:hypothetical protein